jgi:hypothetical protein
MLLQKPNWGMRILQNKYYLPWKGFCTNNNDIDHFISEVLRATSQFKAIPL